jgi:hypothetical protein
MPDVNLLHFFLDILQGKLVNRSECLDCFHWRKTVPVRYRGNRPT